MPSRTRNEKIHIHRSQYQAVSEASGFAEIVYKCPSCRKILIGKDSDHFLEKSYSQTVVYSIDLQTRIARATIEPSVGPLFNITLSLSSEKDWLKRIEDIKRNPETEEEEGGGDSSDSSDFLHYSCSSCGHQMISLSELIIEVKKHKPDNAEMERLTGINVKTEDNKELPDTDVDFGNIEIVGKEDKIINKRWEEFGLTPERTGGIVCTCGQEVIIQAEDVNSLINCPRCGQEIPEDVVAATALR